LYFRILNLHGSESGGFLYDTKSAEQEAKMAKARDIIHGNLKKIFDIYLNCREITANEDVKSAVASVRLVIRQNPEKMQI
jgi:hypothetical protein